MKKIIPFISSIILVLIMLPTYAFDGITYYSTTISNNDRYNSNGEKLSSVRAILRQDRANFYKFGTTNRGDEGDDFFASTSHRSMFDSVPIRVNPGLARDIVSGGNVGITVFVYQSHIEVREK